MRFALRIARLLTTALSICLVLGSVLSSAQAKTAHMGGVITAVTLPCHHALSSDDASPMPKSPLDLCRELCLTQAPDAALAAVAVTPDTTVVTIAIPADTSAREITVPTRPAQHTFVPAPKLRRQPYPTTTRLLI